jgi:hypothetical protein
MCIRDSTREQVQPGMRVRYQPMDGVSCIAVIDGEPWPMGSEADSACAVLVSELPPEFTQKTGRGAKSGKCITTLAYISAIEPEKPPLFRFTQFSPERFESGQPAAEPSGAEKYAAAGFTEIRESPPPPGTTLVPKFFARWKDGSKWLIDPNTKRHICCSDTPVTEWRIDSRGPVDIKTNSVRK